MIEAYAIGVSARLEDDISPGLLRIIDSLTRANTAMLEFSANARNISRLGLTIGKNLDKAAAGATALGDASPALTRASYVLDTMVVSSADIARNLKVARAEGAGMGSVIPGSPARPPSGTGGGSASSGDGRSQTARNAGGAVAIGAMYGLYENANLQDTNIMAAATSQIAMPLWIKTSEELKDREFAYARQYAFATHGDIHPFGDAMLESSRLLRTLSPEQQRIMTDSAMPYAAVESKLKGVALPEAMQALIGLAHQAGAYTPESATPLFESMLQASLTTHASLGQIRLAASYALPALHASGANSSDVMYMLATMMQAGILNTKSGTWINNMAMNALPNTLGSGLFSNKKQNEALHLLGLYKGNKAQFYKHGEFNLMQEVAILADARTRMDALKFNAATRQAFGIQGQRAASLFSEPQVVENLATLRALSQNAQSPMDVGEAIQTLSMVGQADKTIANANMTLMNATTTFMGPASAAMSGASSFFGRTADYTKQHPIIGGAMDAGLIVGGVVLGAGLLKGGGAMADWVGKKAIPAILKNLWKLALGGLDIVSTASIEAAMGASIVATGAAAAALGATIAGAVGYGVGTLINKGIDGALSYVTGHKTTLGGEIFDATHSGGGGNVSTGKVHYHNHVVVQIDGHDVRHQILHNMPSAPAHSQSGLNQQHSPLRPSLNAAHGL